MYGTDYVKDITKGDKSVGDKTAVGTRTFSDHEGENQGDKAVGDKAATGDHCRSSAGIETEHLSGISGRMATNVCSYPCIFVVQTIQLQDCS